MRRRAYYQRSIPAFVAALLVVAPSGPGRAADDVSETRSVAHFDRIRLQGAFAAEITAGARETRVLVSGRSDVVRRVTMDVRDGTLVIGMRSGSGFFQPSPKLTIDVPVLRAFSNEGAGSATIGGLAGNDFAIENSGAASIVASGRAKHESISLNGTGKIDATGVDARDVSVDNNGVGSVKVRASGVLSMNVNGVGEIRYMGEPTHVESHVNGIGRIGRL